MPLRDLNIALLPIDIASCDVNENLARIERNMSLLKPGMDIVVLPELCTTGFTDNATLMNESAETDDGKCINYMKQKSRRLNAAICGSFLARDHGALYNRAFFVTPEGEVTYYDKHHLFSAGGEGKLITAGSKHWPVVQYGGWRVAMCICYDLRFPVWMRNIDLAYDLMIVPANWPDSRAYAWTQLLKARAIENQACVVGCDRSGADEFGNYSPDNSLVTDALGRDITERDDKSVIAYGTLKANEIEVYRKRFKPYLDADKFEII